MLGKRHPDFQIDYEWDGDLEDCIQLIEMNQVDWKVVMEEILVQIESGEEVWITWIAERLNLLSESMGVSIPILRRINRLATSIWNVGKRNCWTGRESVHPICQSDVVKGAP